MTDAANPVLIELTRGKLVESIHRGAVSIVDAQGTPILTFGDTMRPVFPRSAIKPLQAIPLIASGAAQRFGLTRTHVALACGSHSGSPDHVRWASEMLAKAGLSEDALACGAHRPLDPKEADRMHAEGRVPSQLQNNCSGKHAGMLLTAVHMGEPIAGYLDASHPVQQRIKAVLEKSSGHPIGQAVCGIDGCGVPNWAMPLRHLALAFARLVSGKLEGKDGATAEDVLAACWAEPLAVAGQNRLDTKLLQRWPGEVVIKTGAEGVYCAAVKSRGFGIALKVDDGARRASEMAIVEVLASLVPGFGQASAERVLSNWRGRRVGEKRLSTEFSAALATLRH